NVPGILTEAFSDYRKGVDDEFRKLGYVAEWRLMQSSDYGVSQLRPRVVMVAARPDIYDAFAWPEPSINPPPTVGELLVDEMGSNGWEGAKLWAKRANRIAPTLVGGSKKHGGPDLGPTRSRAAWKELGIDGGTLAEEPPPAGFKGLPRLTVRMAAMVQGFPASWHIIGRKTAAYRQVGNAFPPPV